MVKEREEPNEKERNPQPRKARRLSNARITFLKGKELISYLTILGGTIARAGAIRLG